MARAINRLTALSVTRLGPGMHADGGGLYLCVNPDGARSWRFRFMLNRRPREMGLGPLHTVPLAEARRRAQEARLKRLDGVDPIEARRGARLKVELERAKTISFHDCARDYIAKHHATWKNRKHAAQWTATLETYAFPHFGKLAVAAIDTGLVMRALEPIWTLKPETASRLRGRIEAILDHASARGYRDGLNPARWKGHLEQSLPRPSKAKRAKQRAAGRGEHFAALPWREVPEFMRQLRQRDTVASRALEFAVLTAVRTENVIGGRGGELDCGERLWSIPALRMKMDRDFRVPLPAAAWRLVADVKGDDYLFPSPIGGAGRSTGLSNAAMRKLLQEDMGYGKRATVHGFRSSFRDWAAETTHFSPEVAEMALAHVVGDKVEAAYRRGDLFDKRRQLMQAWADFCDGRAIAGTVVELRRG